MDSEWAVLSWDSSKNGTGVIKTSSRKSKIKNDSIHFIKAKALEDICPLPKKNEQYRIITQKQFNAYALILNTIKLCTIEEMYLAVYRINLPTVESIISLIESGHIKRSVFIISRFFTATNKAEKWAEKLRSFCDEQPNSIAQHVYTDNHAKVLALKTANKDYLVFEGSGNMSGNGRIEQYLYENNYPSFSFHKEWMSELIISNPDEKYL